MKLRIYIPLIVFLFSLSGCVSEIAPPKEYQSRALTSVTPGQIPEGTISEGHLDEAVREKLNADGGGGGIAFHALDAETTIANNDELVFYDVLDSAYYKILFSDLTNRFLTQETDPGLATHEANYIHADIALNTASRHDAVTVVDTATIDLTLTGQQLSAEYIGSAGGGATTEAELESDLTDVSNVWTSNDIASFSGWDTDSSNDLTTSTGWSGDLSGTGASPTVTNDSHNHTSSTISGLDISDDTNLTAGSHLTLTDDSLSVDDDFVTNTGGDTMAPTLTISDSSTTAPLNLTERSTVPGSPGSGDLYLDDGTNCTGSGPCFRRYNGSGWEDVDNLGEAGTGEENQNAFSFVTDGTDTAAADSETDTFTLTAGTGIGISINTSTDAATLTNSDSGTSAVSTHESTYNHASFLTSESDPAVTTHESTYNHANYDIAYGWGDHSAQNYLDLDVYPNADTDSTNDYSSSDFVTDLTAASTSDLSEGTNLYYTDERAQDATGAMLDDGTVGEIVFLYNDGTPLLSGTVQDGEIDHNSLANTHNLTTDIDHDQLANFSADEHFQQANITTLGTVTSGDVSSIESDPGVTTHESTYNHASFLTSESDPVFAAMDTEAELETQLGSLNVFTSNDGALNDDDVTLTDVQSATSSDFHTIGGTDDDVPESGDFGNASDLESDGSLSADVVAAAEMADADHGDISWSSGVASIDTGVVGSDELASTAVSAGSYTNADITVDDDGRISAASDGDPFWTDESSFTRTDNDTLSVSSCDNYAKGTPIRFSADKSTWYYAVVTACSSGSVDFDGVALSTSIDDYLQWGDHSRLKVKTLIMPGNCVVADPFTMVLYWQEQAGYVIRTTGRTSTAPVGSAVTFNTEINGSDAYSSEISVSAGSTAEFDSGVTVNTSNYDIQFSETLTISTSQCGSSTLGGSPLTFSISIIIP